EFQILRRNPQGSCSDRISPAARKPWKPDTSEESSRELQVMRGSRLAASRARYFGGILKGVAGEFRVRWLARMIAKGVAVTHHQIPFGCSPPTRYFGGILKGVAACHSLSWYPLAMTQILRRNPRFLRLLPSRVRTRIRKFTFLICAKDGKE